MIGKKAKSRRRRLKFRSSNRKNNSGDHMRTCHQLSALILLSTWAVNIPAADLTKIERTIAKEPAYIGKPKYCVLVFGPEAKTRIWLALDGIALYVDRTGVGDLTEKRHVLRPCRDGSSKRECIVGDIIDVDGKTKYTDLKVTCLDDDGMGRIAHISISTPIGRQLTPN